MAGSVGGALWPFAWLEAAGHELLLFAGVFFLIGAIDELAVDLAWAWLKLTGRAPRRRFAAPAEAPLARRFAVLVPAWAESHVVGTMLAHTLRAWPQAGLRIYAGCYRNDPATVAAMVAATAGGRGGGDPRLRIVVHDAAGPTTKADCLNRLYAAMIEDKRRGGPAFDAIVLHDAEDLVHPAALALLDHGLDTADFVQLPVVPAPQRSSRWIAGHYADEFAEAHAKALVVRDALGASIPAAGVGCAFARTAIDRVAEARGDRAAPFAADCLTEDYELGLLVSELGGVGRFVRAHDADGELIATREYFPATLAQSIGQKSRWLHGIAFQGWDRLGWGGGVAECWMRLRDRRGPLTAIVLAAAYVLVLVWGVLAVAQVAGWHQARPPEPALAGLLAANLAFFVWRAVVRAGFTAAEHGAVEGVRAVFRLPLANFIAILAGRRAISAYLGSLRGRKVSWDKTEHRAHPAHAAMGAAA